MQKLIGKIIIKADLILLTGLHIGGSNEFSSIGAVDSIIVRDPLSKEPIIPGSSVKGKMRNLLARSFEGGPHLEISREPYELKRLFGGNKGSEKEQNLIASRLQFPDLFMKRESVEKIKSLETDLLLTEIKFENTINRVTGIAAPRQMERVPAGAEFDFILIYNVENENELEEDFANIKKGLKLLEYDYLGGGGSRGNGRIKLENFSLETITTGDDVSLKTDDLEKLLNNET
ncbi:MAG: type III-A CRISPR-associated RAMP protein Csm3 [Thermosyntropha sp.]|nr:type III-A CRISPR-associated RAMP protein Csm3 [Thermosyntropha sp.]